MYKKRKSIKHFNNYFINNLLKIHYFKMSFDKDLEQRLLMRSMVELTLPASPISNLVTCG
jgi:hypothetical protein